MSSGTYIVRARSCHSFLMQAALEIVNSFQEWFYFILILGHQDYFFNYELVQCFVVRNTLCPSYKEHVLQVWPTESEFWGDGPSPCDDIMVSILFGRVTWWGTEESGLYFVSRRSFLPQTLKTYIKYLKNNIILFWIGKLLGVDSPNMFYDVFYKIHHGTNGDKHTKYSMVRNAHGAFSNYAMALMFQCVLSCTLEGQFYSQWY